MAWQASTTKKTFLHQYFRIIGICLGVPPTEFSWEYYDKSKEYHKVGPISPLEFYNENVKKLFDVDEKVKFIDQRRYFNDVVLVF